MRNLEIERKFLVAKPPLGFKQHQSAKIIQGYFPMRSKDVEIRVRRKGTEHFITIKGGRGEKRTEVETGISKERFRALWPLTMAGHISKRRYKIPLDGGNTAELDVYEGPHRGLITADVEFDSIQKSQAFKPPEWMGREITGSRKYANAVLARRGRLPPNLKRT